MDRLIVGYFDVNTVTNKDILGMRVADETEAEAIEASFVAQYNSVLNNADKLNIWRGEDRLNLQPDEDLPAFKTFISDSQDDIKILREAHHYIAGWDKLYNRFILNGTLLNIKRYIVSKRLNAIDREYRTSRTLSDAINGDEWAIARLAEAEALCVPIRAEMAELTDE
jgi:hypothetical protein